MLRYDFTVGVHCCVLNEAPSAPGVYIIAADRKAAYIGQSVNIRSRVWQHFCHTSHIYQSLQAFNRENMMLLYFTQDDCDHATGIENGPARRVVESMLILKLRPAINRHRLSPKYLAVYPKTLWIGFLDNSLHLFVRNKSVPTSEYLVYEVN